MGGPPPPSSGTGGDQVTGSGGTSGSGGSSGTGGASNGSGGESLDVAAGDTSPDDVVTTDDVVDGSGSAGDGDDSGDVPTVDDASDASADGGFPVGGPIGTCIPLNWTVQASQSASADQASRAVDDIAATRWSSGVPQAPGINYRIDFGGYVRLGQVRLDSGGSPGDFPRGFEVAASTDGVDFSNMIASGAPGDLAPAGNITTIDFAPVILRVLRIQLNASSGSWWSIHELGVDCQISDGNGGVTTDVVPDNLRCQADGGTPAAGSGPFDRANWTLTASSTSTFTTDVITNVTDGKTATRWSSGVAQMPGQFFKVDLGSEGCVGQIVMTSSGSDFAVGYSVAVSLDDVAYQIIARGTGALVTTIPLPSHRARYVRIDETGSSGSWWSINELTITP